MIANIELLNLLVGGVLPLLVGLVTKEVASSGLKGVLNALLSAVSGVLITTIDNQGVIVWTEAINAGVTTFLISISTYYGIHKPTGLAGRVNSVTSGFGLGSKEKAQVVEDAPVIDSAPV